MTQVSNVGYSPVFCDTHLSVNTPQNTCHHSLFERIAHVAEGISRAVEERRASLKDRALRLIDEADDYLEKKIPLLPHQKVIDQLTAAIQRRFAPLGAFNAWVYSNGGGAWYRELATCLCKLPLRAALNIVNLLYNIIKESLCFSVHPAKSVLRLARLCVRLLDALTTPETWALVGAGMLGSSGGYCLLSGTPFPLIGGAIGAAMVIGGISIGAMKRALLAENGEKWHEVGKFFSLQARKLPEAALTGFFMGLIAGGIQRAVANRMNYQVTSYEEAKQIADTFIQKHNLPPYSEVFFDQTGKVFIKWGNGCDLSKFTAIEREREWVEWSCGSMPKEWLKDYVEQATIELAPKGSCGLHMFVRYGGRSEVWYDTWVTNLSLSRVACLMHDVSWLRNLYPRFIPDLSSLTLSAAIPAVHSQIKDTSLLQTQLCRL